MGGCCTKTHSTDREERVRTKNQPSNRRRGRQRDNYQPVQERTSHGRSHGYHVNLNTANVHELSVLPGITSHKALAIVEYRTTHGPFTSINDILNIQGIGPQTLDKIQDKVYVTSHDHKRGLHDNINLHTVPTKGKHSLRIGSWNLKCFSVERISDKKVLEIVCTTILNNQLDLIAVQEVASPDALQMICDELNNPTLRSVKSHDRHKWTCAASQATGRMYQSLEYNGFLWNDNKSIQLISSGLLGGKPVHGQDRFVRKPFIGYFKVGKWRFVVVCIHLKATGLDGSDIPQLKTEIHLLPSLMKAIKDQGHSDSIVLGDFNMDSSDNSFKDLHNTGYTNIIPSNTPTNISGRNPRGSHQYDNIWINDKVGSRYEKKWHVVRDGLKINDNETVSDHCPVWADFRV